MGTSTRRPHRRYRLLPYLFALSGLAVVVAGALLQWSFRVVLVALAAVLATVGAWGWVSLQASGDDPGMDTDGPGAE